MNTRICQILTLITVFILTACAPAKVPATPTLLPTPIAPALPSPTATVTPTATEMPLPTSTPTPKPTRTPSPTPPAPTTVVPLADNMVEFEFGGQAFQVTGAFLAPTCAQAAVKAGDKEDILGVLPKGNNCVVIVLNLPDMTDMAKAIEMSSKLQASDLVDQDGGKIPQEPYLTLSLTQGSKMGMSLFFVVKPTGKTFTWMLPDGQEIAIIPAE